tara:strand:+ start:56 stop:1201 length:1146 start_codon:yes stop_codon:yes gene_type:complete
MKLNSYFFQIFSIANFFLNVFIVFLFLFFGYHDIAAQGFVAISISNIFTYGFSGNARNIYLGSKTILSLKKIIFFRLLISVIAALSSSIIIYFFLSKPNFFYLFSILILTVSSFIFELLIARTEKNDLPNKYYALNLFLFFVNSIILIYFQLLNFFVIYVFIYVFINCFLFKNFFKNLFFTDIKFFVNLQRNLNIGIYSSFLKSISNLIWRYSAFILLGNSKSAILFMAFSLGSFFGTLFDISYGALFLKKLKNKIHLFLNSFYLAYVFLTYLLVLFFKKFSTFTVAENNFLYSATLFSLFGSYIIMFALKLRQKFFEIQEMQNFCFKVDIVIYFFNSLIIPIIFLINKELVILAYLISSTFFYLMYKIIVHNDFKKMYKK